MKFFNQRTICSSFSIILILFGLSATYLLGHDTLVLKPIEFGKDYSYQFSEKKLKDPQWKIGMGNLPKCLTLDKSGKLHGQLMGKEADYKGQKFEFLVVAWEKANHSSYYTYKVILKIAPNGKKNKKKQEKKKEKPKKGEGFRFIAGYEFSRANSILGQEQVFADFYVNIPLPLFRGDFWKGRVSLWGDFRLTTIPRQNSSKLGDLPTKFFADIKDLKFNEITQALDFMGGLEILLKDSGSDYSIRQYSLSFIVSAGVIFPTTPQGDSIPIFKITNELKNEHPGGNYEYVAFVPTDRDRSLRQYYFGFRIKTFAPNRKDDDTPALLDLTFGLNDAATGGRGNFFKGTVFRIDGFHPFQISGIPVYIFGTIVVNTSKETLRTPSFFEKAPDDVVITNKNVFIYPVPESNRDYYRVGIGLDLWTLFAKAFKK